tara:strand:- start:7029 stop:7256 length:228 start_codon:yes stop_codon:yes gene_type:complete
MKKRKMKTIEQAKVEKKQKAKLAKLRLKKAKGEKLDVNEKADLMDLSFKFWDANPTKMINKIKNQINKKNMPTSI